jgi:hypothetical protein
MKRLAIVVLAVAAAAGPLAHNTPVVHAQPVAAGCWQRPAPQTLEEIAVRAANQRRRKQRRLKERASRAAKPPASVLALSNPSSRAKAAYGAGLLVGWGETGNRPDFATVTAVGASALVAPFAFIGEGGDQKIADLFACQAASFAEIAERAVAYLDAPTLEAIARKYEAGNRLWLVLPGSAARKETTWDAGAIAARRTPQALSLLRSILLASVDVTTFVDPAASPVREGTVTKRNITFRKLGAGEPFLYARATRPRATTYLIHNGVLFPDQGTAYMADRRATGSKPGTRMHVVSAYDFFLAQTARANIYVASPRPYLSIQPSGEDDMKYVRDLFQDSYRQGVLNREWRRTFVDSTRSY